MATIRVSSNKRRSRTIHLIALTVLGCIMLLFITYRSHHDAHRSVVPRVKMSSLSYASAANRVGFDYNNYYNDFTSEGHMYPVHGVGDLDRTRELMKHILRSVSGAPFPITDLGVSIRVADQSLVKRNGFYDFHSIPTKHLDGSTKLPDGTRIEQHIPYFNKHAARDFPKSVASIDWISGDAKFDAIPSGWDRRLLSPIPTTLSSTRQTPFMGQSENLALTFFMDGKQSRVNNGGRISNFRYIVPAYGSELNWFVAKAWVECAKHDSGARRIRTTNGARVWVRARTKEETDDLESISYNQNRYMETVSASVTITNSSEKFNAFNQRYGNKALNFGDIILVDQRKSYLSSGGDWEEGIDGIFDTWVGRRAPEHREKQIAFHEMIHYAAKLLDDRGQLPSPYQYVREGTMAHAVFTYIKKSFLNDELYDISITALATKAQLAKSYIPTPVGETGWMIVDKPDELVVPDDDGEYFIGWTVKTQPTLDAVTQSDSSINGDKKAVIRWCQTNGYAIHQGPGILFLTGGDMAHHGTQEPYLLKHNYPPVPRKGESEDEFIRRRRCQLPLVHWRLDRPHVIFRSNEVGSFTEANVGAAQNMLFSVGTKTRKDLPSRSPNFLGRYYQDLLAQPQKIQQLRTRKARDDEVYQVTDVEQHTFIYGETQQTRDDDRFSMY